MVVVVVGGSRVFLLRWAVGPLLPGGGRQSKGVDNPRRGGLTPLAVSLTLYGRGSDPLAVRSTL